VTVGGRELWIEGSGARSITRSDDELKKVLPCKDVEIVRDDRIFDAVRVACGRCGVIYSLVIEVRPQFRVVQVVTSPSGTAVMQALRDGKGSPIPFRQLLRLLDKDPAPDGLDDARGDPYSLQIVFNSQRTNDTWVTRRWETDSTRPDIPDSPKPSFHDLAVAIVAIANATLGFLAGTAGATAGAVGTILGSILGGPLGGLLGGAAGSSVAITITDIVAQLDLMLATGNAPFGSIVAAALNGLWKIPGAALVIPEINHLVIENDFADKKAKGRRGPHYLIAAGSRADSDQDDFRVDSIELVFDAAAGTYLDFLDEVLALAPLFPQAGIISLRPSLACSAHLSMHHVASPRTMSVEIASLKNLPGNAIWMAYLHQAAIRHNGRPHWGQYNKLDEVAVAMLYGESLNAWREALLAVSGTSMLFSNDFTRRRGLEPQAIAREVTSVKKRQGTITHLCNDGQFWSPIAVRQAIDQIRAGTIKYVARSSNARALIKAVSDGHGGFYVRSQADRTSANNLDNLPLSMVP
jgi:hypothetical protein